MDTLHINIKHLRSFPSIGSVIMTSSNDRMVAMDTGDNVSGVREYHRYQKSQQKEATDDSVNTRRKFLFDFLLQ